MKLTRRNTYILSCTCSAVVVATLLCVFPSASWSVQLVQLVAAGALAGLVYRVLCRPDTLGSYVLLGAWTLLSAGYALNCYYFTTYSGGTPEAPVLINNDAFVAWQQLVSGVSGFDNHLEGRRLTGFATFLRLFIGGGTPLIGDVLLLSVVAVLLTIVLTGATAARLSGDASGRTAAVAMLLISSVSYFLASGVLVLKDAYMCLLMSGWLFALSVIMRGRRVVASLVMMLLFIPSALLVRPHMLPFAALASLCALPFCRGRRMVWICGVAVLAAASYFLLRQGQVSTVFNTDGTAAMVIDTTPGRLEAYRLVAADYQNLPVWQRIVRLPFALAVQWLTPLPWAFGRDVVFGPSQAWAHFALPWYVVGGIMLYFLFFCLCKAPRAVSAIFVFGVVAWIATAFVTGGTVSRYCLPWLPALIPGAAWVIVSGNTARRSFSTWMWVYAVVIVAAVAVALCVLGNTGTWEAV